MRDLDVILGMDWLRKYQADTKCLEREVTLHLPNKEEIALFGERSKTPPKVIYTMKAMKMLEKNNYQGFVVNLKGDQKLELNAADVPIVRDFSDIFPEDQPGVPPARQVEFTIDLVLRATSISKAPYRIAPKKLEELKVQIQSLLDLGFIRPSVSPWRAPVLFVKKKDGTMRMCIDYQELN